MSIDYKMPHCSKYRKTKSPKCDNQKDCKWKVGKGCKSKAKSCKKFRKTKAPKCEDRKGCTWTKGTGCHFGKKSKGRDSLLLGHIKPVIIKKFYQMTYDTCRILEANDIPFVAEGGTSLGAIRNKGIIPWDDDVDLGLLNKDKKKLLALRPVFAKCGYSMVKVWFGYKLFYTKDKLLKGFNYAHPFIDFFFLVKKGGRWVHSLKAVRETWPKFYYNEDQFQPFQKVPFGDFTIPVVQNVRKVLDRMYGKDWSTHGYREYDHAKEEEIEPVKVKLTKAELGPAKPTKVKDRSCMGKAPLTKEGIGARIPLRKASKGCLPSASRGCEARLSGKVMPVYVINCDIHQKRIKKFREYAKAARLPACREVCVNGKAFDKDMICQMVKSKLLDRKVDMTPIEVSICYSHLNVWQRFVDSCKDYALVIEDDAEVHKDFKKMLNKTLKALHDKGKKFDILYLWNGNWADSLEATKKVLKVDDKITVLRETTAFNAGAVSYVLTKGFAKTLLRNAYPIDHPIDVYMGEEGVARGKRALTIEMSYDSKKACYLSPFFRGTEWICGGEEGTGNTTQDYKAKTVKGMRC
jgi:lipopolysaccharide cholinephosphotransferase